MTFFARNPAAAALAWLRAIRVGVISYEGIAPVGSLRWQSPSIDAMRDRMSGATEVHIIAATLCGSGISELDATRTSRWMRDLVETTDHVALHLHVQDSKPLAPEQVSSSEIDSVLTLAALEAKGQLIVHRNSRHLAASESRTPRVLACANGELRAFYSNESDRPVLAGAVVGDMFTFSTPVIAAEDDAALTTLRARLLNGPVIQNAFVNLKNDSQTFDFKVNPGIPRNWQAAFAALSGKQIETLTIADPYLLSGRSAQKSAAAFVHALVSLGGGAFKRIQLRWKQGGAGPKGTGLQPNDEKAARDNFCDALKRSKSGVATDAIEFKAVKLFPNQDFHDRRVTATYMDGTVKKSLRWDVSSGINNLLDSAKESVVYQIKR